MGETSFLMNDSKYSVKVYFIPYTSTVSILLTLLMSINIFYVMYIYVYCVNPFLHNKKLLIEFVIVCCTLKC